MVEEVENRADGRVMWNKSKKKQVTGQGAYASGGTRHDTLTMAGYNGRNANRRMFCEAAC